VAAAFQGDAFQADAFELGGGTDNLTATGITTGTPTLGAPSLAQIHALLALDLDGGTPVLDAPALGGDTPPPPEIHTGGAWSWKPQKFEPRVDRLLARSIVTAPPTLGMPVLTVSLGPEQRRRRRAALIAALH
jgi:hypothetical protein